MSTVFHNYIDGEWRFHGQQFENRNPATGEVVCRFCRGSASDMADAANAAARAFPACP